MKRTLFLSLLLTLGLAACNMNDDPGGPTGGGDTGGGGTGGDSGDLTSQSYDVGPQAYLNVAEGAEVTFAKVENGTEVTIDFGGAIGSDFPQHPAHIHEGEAGSGGNIVVTLEPVDTTTGVSTTTVTNFNGSDGTPGAGDAVTYEELVSYAGYVNVHLSPDDLDVIVASANTGSNSGVTLPAVPSIAELVTSQAQDSENAEFTILLEALTAANLAATFGADADGGPYTVLAPTDAAFEALLTELSITKEELLAREDLSDILSYHVLPNVLVRSEVVAAAGVEGGTSGVATLLTDGSLTLTTDTDGNIVINNRSQVIVESTNIEASNGVIHAIDAVLAPFPL